MEDIHRVKDALADVDAAQAFIGQAIERVRNLSADWKGPDGFGGFTDRDTLLTILRSADDAVDSALDVMSDAAKQL
tara:strand:+ start:8162 stop:8389 length:228 start_codon:yes stop_codon:yes gene_type:complete